VCEPTTTQVIEKVEQTEPSWTEKPPVHKSLGTSFHYHASHGHLHLEALVDLGLFSSGSGNRKGEGEKISFQLFDANAFDEEIQAEVRNTPDAQWNREPELAQGISPGYKDTYGAHLPGQSIILGERDKVKNDLAGRDYEIRVDVDPQRTLTERTRANNRAAVDYTIPKWSSSSGFCEKTRGCGDYPEDERWYDSICENYAEYYCTEVSSNPIWCSDYGF
jgi:hypothetical protein